MRQTLKKLRNYRTVFGSRGLLLALRTKLSRGMYEASVVPDRLAHPVFFRLKTSDLETYVKVFVEREYELSLSRAPSVIVDAGANVGFAAIFFASLYPNARVLAIEPETSNFELLKRNTAPYRNITPIQAALWKEIGTIDIVDPGIGHWGFQAQSASDPGKTKRLCKVPGLTVDSLMKEHGISFIDLLKIDIEGGEKEVFADASAWIDKVGVLAIELHDRFKIGCSRNFYLATKGFEQEQQRGENVFMLRRDYMPDPSAR